MEQKRLDELINFTLGKNISRLKNQNVNIYTPEDFEKDLHSLADVNMICGCIINLIRSKASRYRLKHRENILHRIFCCVCLIRMN